MASRSWMLSRIFLNSDDAKGRVKGLGIQIQGMVQTVARVKPDILLVLGDRRSNEYRNRWCLLDIPVAHVCGGDRVIGNVDDQIRHAVTKLAHIHFPSNQESASELSTWESRSLEFLMLAIRINSCLVLRI